MADDDFDRNNDEGRQDDESSGIDWIDLHLSPRLQRVARTVLRSHEYAQAEGIAMLVGAVPPTDSERGKWRSAFREILREGGMNAIDDLLEEINGQLKEDSDAREFVEHEILSAQAEGDMQRRAHAEAIFQRIRVDQDRLQFKYEELLCFSSDLPEVEALGPTKGEPRKRGRKQLIEEDFAGTVQTLKAMLDLLEQYLKSPPKDQGPGVWFSEQLSQRLPIGKNSMISRVRPALTEVNARYREEEGFSLIPDRWSTRPEYYVPLMPALRRAIQLMENEQ